MPTPEPLRRLAEAWSKSRFRPSFPRLLADDGPLDLRYVGHTLLRVAVVGGTCGVIGALFFGGLEYAQRLLLEDLAGYVPLRAYGEQFAESESETSFRPWLLLFLPALGGLACGLITRLAPEARGGGGDAMIDAYHKHGGVIRPRVIPIKALASFFTLGTGGAGGREGPTMLIGGAVGSWVGGRMALGARERRVFMIAGVAAGISAVFRTPLGAALLAAEILYRDGFESEAVVPAVLASVVSYSVVISFYGESVLLAHPPRFPFHPKHLPLYVLLAILIAFLAWLFVRALHFSRAKFAALAVPAWARPAIGGLLLSVFVVPLLVFIGPSFGREGQGLGLLGGGYGAAQVAITGAPWLPGGWGAVAFLAALSIGKLVAASLTIGSGGSAGDFAPSLAVGGLLGGAFGRAAVLVFDLQDPELIPGAFALVGMGAFYGGVAHTPVAALVLTCEMAGNYDLLVPLMLALGVSYASLRRTTLYEAQVSSVPRGGRDVPPEAPV